VSQGVEADRFMQFARHRPKTEAWRVLWPDTCGSVSYQPDAPATVPHILAAGWENPRWRVGLVYAWAL
jgi:hypothetical protein